MKSPALKLSPSFFKHQSSDQPVRVIKAAQASKLIGSSGHLHNASAGGAHKKPEIRLVRTTADYCDLEVVCGCGESTQVRCWNSPANADAAVAA